MLLHFSIIRTRDRFYISFSCPAPFDLRSKCFAICNLLRSINKWRTFCKMTDVLLSVCRWDLTRLSRFFYSARARRTGGYTLYASVLMLSRLFVSVRRTRLRNAWAVTARLFIEINIPEAERRFYTELAGAPLGSYRAFISLLWWNGLVWVL